MHTQYCTLVLYYIAKKNRNSISMNWGAPFIHIMMPSRADDLQLIIISTTNSNIYIQISQYENTYLKEPVLNELNRVVDIVGQHLLRNNLGTHHASPQYGRQNHGLRVTCQLRVVRWNMLCLDIQLKGSSILKS